MKNNQSDCQKGPVSCPKPRKADTHPKRNEDYAKYGAGHTRLTIEDFLRTKANDVPDTAIKTWRWWGEDYYAQYAEQDKDDTVYVTLYPDESIENWRYFPAKALMGQIYDQIE